MSEVKQKKWSIGRQVRHKGYLKLFGSVVQEERMEVYIHDSNGNLRGWWQKNQLELYDHREFLKSELDNATAKLVTAELEVVLRKAEVETAQAAYDQEVGK